MNKNEKWKDLKYLWKNKKYLGYFIVTFMIIVVISIFVGKCTDWFILGSDVYSNVSNEVWMSFLGSYIGSIMGGMITLIGVVITICFTLRQAKEDRKLSIKLAKKDRDLAIQLAKEDRKLDMEKFNEEKRLAIAPYLKYTQYKNRPQGLSDCLCAYYGESNSNTKVECFISLKNIGLGPVTDIYITDVIYNEKKSNTISTSIMPGVIEKNEEKVLTVGVSLRLEDMEDIHTFNKSELKRTSYGYDIPKKYISKNLSFKVNYKDLLNNEYEQFVLMNVDMYRDKQDEKTITFTYSPIIILLKTDPAILKKV